VNDTDTSSSTGPATALVLLHGFPLDHRMWDDLTGSLATDLQVLAPDLPGLGGAAVPDGEPSVDRSADEVAALVEAAGHERVVVAGLSMGGYVALALAERHPGLVAGLALVDTKSTADEEPARANRERVADEVESSGSVEAVLGMVGSLLSDESVRERPDLPSIVTGWIREQQPSGIAWSQRAMATRSDRSDVLADFDGPVVVVVGEDDTITPLAAAQHMASTARDAELVTVPGAGHLSALEAPGPVAAALDRLLRRAAEATPTSPESSTS